MSFIVVRRAADEKERDQVYGSMYEGNLQVSYTLGTKAARLDKGMAEIVAKQLNGMFPAHKWDVMHEGDFKYRPLPASAYEPKGHSAN